MRSLELSNDFDTGRSLEPHCQHGSEWNSCIDPGCREVWDLYQKQSKDIRDELKGAHHALKGGGQKKSQYEIELEERPQLEFIDEKEAADVDEQSTTASKIVRRFADIFPDDITIRAAVQYQGLTPRQGKILKKYLKAEKNAIEAHKDLKLTVLWKQIGQKVGCSGKTVEREFKKLVERVFVEKMSRPKDPPGAIKLVRVRGERRPRFYRVHSVQFGKWSQTWSELITDRKAIQDILRKGQPLIRSQVVPIRSSSMNRLFGDLIATFADGLQNPQQPPKYISATDWDYNVQRARRILAGKNHRTGPWTASEIYTTLGRGSKLCKTCHGPILKTFRLNGRKITRERQFCDNSCKMKFERRKKKLVATRQALSN